MKKCLKKRLSNLVLDRMKCKKCSKKRAAKEYCNSHFSELIEKKAKKAIREAGWLKRNDRVLVLNDRTKEGVAAEFLLKKVVGGLPLRITVRRKKGSFARFASARFDRVILLTDLDDEIEGFILELFEGKKPARLKNELRILRYITDEEIKLFLRIKKIRFREKNKSRLGGLLDSFEKKNPDIKLSLSSAAETFRKLSHKTY